MSWLGPSDAKAPFPAMDSFRKVVHPIDDKRWNQILYYPMTMIKGPCHTTSERKWRLCLRWWCQLVVEAFSCGFHSERSRHLRFREAYPAIRSPDSYSTSFRPISDHLLLSVNAVCSVLDPRLKGLIRLIVACYV
jgi:hypothetical protein